MSAFVALLLALVLSAALLGRFTRLHPLVIAFIGAVPGFMMGVFVAASLMSPSAWLFGVIAAVVTATASAFGAFLGWLRRENLKRKQ